MQRDWTNKEKNIACDKTDQKGRNPRKDLG